MDNAAVEDSLRREFIAMLGGAGAIWPIAAPRSSGDASDWSAQRHGP